MKFCRLFCHNLILVEPWNNAITHWVVDYHAQARPHSISVSRYVIYLLKTVKIAQTKFVHPCTLHKVTHMLVPFPKWNSAPLIKKIWSIIRSGKPVLYLLINNLIAYQQRKKCTLQKTYQRHICDHSFSLGIVKLE